MGYVTRHGKQRIKERIGIGKNEKSINRVVEKALKFGIPHSETSGALRRYIDKHFLAYRKGNNMRVYGDKLFVFSDDILITILQLPSNITKNMKVYKKET